MERSSLLPRQPEHDDPLGPIRILRDREDVVPPYGVNLEIAREVERWQRSAERVDPLEDRDGFTRR